MWLECWLGDGNSGLTLGWLWPAPPPLPPPGCLRMHTNLFRLLPLRLSPPARLEEEDWSEDEDGIQLPLSSPLLSRSPGLWAWARKVRHFKPGP